MRRVYVCGLFATLAISLSVAAVAAEQQPLTGLEEDDVAPLLEDNLPPGASPASLLDDGKTFELRDKAALLTGEQPKISMIMQPFNSMRIKLIQAAQQQPKTVTIQGQRIALKNPQRVARFYELAQYPAVWTQEHHFKENLSALQQVIHRSEDDALNPQRYHARYLLPLQANVDYDDIVAYELLASDAYLTLLGDLANGLVNPKVTQPTWNAPKINDDILAELLAQGVVQNNLAAVAASLNAHNPRYQGLKRQYNTLRHGGATQSALSALAINMERQRWMPQELGRDYILVNIPGFYVSVLQNGQVVYHSRAVVGRKSRQTPTFVNHLRYIVMSPTWTVPPTIMSKDKLPRLRSNPAAFDGAYEAVTPSGRVVPPSSVSWYAGNGYSLRQKSGPHNALGRVKFLFPNPHAIYIHDTPHKELFGRKVRAYSSGCVRIQKPIELANLLLNGAGWSSGQIEQATSQTHSRWVNAPKEMPVYLVYWTRWADLGGTLHQANDIYDLDARLMRQYNSALSHP